MELQSVQVQAQWHSSAEDFAERVVARAEVIRERMNSMRSTAHDNICATQKTQKRHYYVKRRPPTFSIGDRVYRYNCRRDTRKGGKLATRYDGPFFIAEVLGKGSYRLEKPTAWQFCE